VHILSSCCSVTLLNLYACVGNLATTERSADTDCMPLPGVLRSYLQQRRNRQGPHFTYELIIVDDGSKDKTVRYAWVDQRLAVRSNPWGSSQHTCHASVLYAAGWPQSLCGSMALTLSEC
jgi:hypothetical protein